MFPGNYKARYLEDGKDVSIPDDFYSSDFTPTACSATWSVTASRASRSSPTWRSPRRIGHYRLRTSTWTGIAAITRTATRRCAASAWHG